MDKQTIMEQISKHGCGWYVCCTVSGYEIVHATSLSAILQCRQSMRDYGYQAMYRCSGEDYAIEDMDETEIDEIIAAQEYRQ